MTEKSDKFPDWSKPATKGDVLMAMIYTRGVAVSLLNLARATQPADQRAFDAALADFHEKWKASERAMEVVAGTRASLDD